MDNGFEILCTGFWGSHQRAITQAPTRRRTQLFQSRIFSPKCIYDGNVILFSSRVLPAQAYGDIQVRLSDNPNTSQFNLEGRLAERPVEYTPSAFL
ncbi:hypothetical protein VKT23_004087 [Stygiomarasmius scandens]|uniref:Uncharacterized protein n=1 Tax=Marasmiellus scandens TaxID=2682957 RepID=A0ABR1JTY5_9AGAR